MNACRKYLSSRVIVSGKPLRRWSLNFVEEGLETGFAQSREADVIAGLSNLFAILSVVSFGSVVRFFPDMGKPLISGESEYPHNVFYIFILVLFVFLCLAFAWTKLRCFRLLSPRKREAMCCAIVILLMVVFCASSEYYRARILGYDPWKNLYPVGNYMDRGNSTMGRECGEVTFGDSRVLSMIYGALIVCNYFLPIRWCMMTTVPLAAAFLYAALAFGLGSPEGGFRASFNLVYLMCGLCFLSLGKRSEEWRERQQFAAIIQEKELRCSTEFQLERSEQLLSKLSSLNSGNSGSKATSVPSRSIAGSSSVGKLPLLDDIATLGRKEHWLINADEITVSTQHILGKGKFAAVVLGFLHGMPVALKISRERNGLQQDLTADMANELRLLRQVRHPNIVMFHGAYVCGGQGSIALAIEFIESGMTLKKFIGNPASSDAVMVPVAQRYEVISGLCSALRYLHSRNPLIVHGDLKDSNIMVESGPRTKLLDFGLSRLVKSGARPLGGTLRWSAPEVILNMCMSPNWAADVFSFGRVLSFIVSGETPLKNLSKQAIFRLAQGGNLSQTQIPSRDKLASHSSDMVCRCLKTDAFDRPSMKLIYDYIALWPAQLHFEPISKCWNDISSQCAVVADGDPSIQLALACQSVQSGPGAEKSADSDSEDSSLCQHKSCFSSSRAISDASSQEGIARHQAAISL